jgi:hypothetical protein
VADDTDPARESRRERAKLRLRERLERLARAAAGNAPIISTRALVDRLAHGDPTGSITFGELLDQFSERSWGIFLLLALLPNFIPIPGAGAVSGPLVVLIGVQLLFHVEHPWLPKFLARRQIPRERLIGFRNHIDKWLGRIEKLIKPRWQAVLDNKYGHAFSGFMLIVLGVILALPIPGTNYIFGALLLGYALALIERDGKLMLVCWGLGLFEMAAVPYISAKMITLGAALTRWAQGLFH